MKPFRDQPIARKITVVVLLTTLAGVLVASLGYLATEIHHTRKAYRLQIETLAEVLAANTTAAVTFEDTQLAYRLLTGLRHQPGFQYARIYSDPQTVFVGIGQTPAASKGAKALFKRPAIATTLRSGQSQNRLDGNRVAVLTPLILDQEVIGAICIQAKIAMHFPPADTAWLIPLFVILAGLLIVALLLTYLQHLIGQPLTALATAMAQMARQQAPSPPLEPKSQDEIGVLIRCFNDMGSQIRERDVHLSAQRTRLEQTVAERTADLNAALQAANQARAEAEQANQAKTQFLARISHEIRTPIHGITGLIELLQDARLSDYQHNLSTHIQQAALSLLELIDDLLDLSRIEAGGLTLQEKPFDLPQLVDSITTLFTERLRHKQLELTTHLPADLPRYYHGGASHLRQVLINLVDNAIKFTDQGTITISVEAPQPTASGDSQWLRFSVTDTGIGIAEDVQAHILEPFAQADESPARERGGSGLGLAICNQLVSLLGGQLQIDSQPGRGTTFSFELPLPRADEPSHPTASAPTPPPQQLAAHVLLAEDQLANQILTHGMLEALGCTVVIAGDGWQALQRLAEETFDLVLLDCEMPSLDGYRTSAAIRQAAYRNRQGQPLPVIALTAYTQLGDHERSLVAGMDDHLAKPFTRADLAAVLQRNLNWTEAGEPAADHVSTATYAAVTTATILDTSIIERIRGLDMNDQPLLAHAVLHYLETTPNRLDALGTAWLHRDSDALARSARQLATVSRNLGVVRVATLAHQLAQLAQQDTDPTLLETTLTTLEQACTDAYAVLKDLL